MASVRDQIQIDQFDEGTRNAIWNEMLMYLESVRNRSLVINRVRVDVFEFALDSQPVIHKYNSLYRRTSEYRVDLDEWLRDKILKGEVCEVLDVVEYLTDQDRADEWRCQYPNSFNSGSVDGDVAFSRDRVNDLFAGMCVGYRFVNEVLCRIVNEEEIKSIESAIAESPDAVAEQLNNALLAFADRERPNYANVVKESISAVESQCCILTGDSKASLGTALKKLEDSGVRIHPALNKALHQLYGYTSDDPGMRHGGAAMANVDVALAQFMLVTCSAFVNYLRTVKVTIGG
jgi:hypothetical protein